MIMWAPWSRTRWHKVRVLSRNGKGNSMVKWLSGPIKGRTALIQTNTMKTRKPA